MLLITNGHLFNTRSHWPRGLSRGTAAASLLAMGVRILPGHGSLSLVSVVCCQVEALRRADHSSRGILSIMVFLNVILKTQ